MISHVSRSAPIVGGHLPRALHLLVAVVPGEEDVAPVEDGHVAARLPLLVRHRAQVGDGDVEAPALPVALVRLLRRAVDRERHLVDARVHEAPRRLLLERQAVGAGVEVDVRELRLHVLAHLDGPLVQERLAVIEEVDAPERRPRFVDHPREEIDVEHAGLARARDAGLRRAAGLEARDVARGRALDVEARGLRRHVETALRRRLALRQRQLQRAVAAERRPAAVQVLAQRGNRRARSRCRGATPCACRPARASRTDRRSRRRCGRRTA